MPALVWSCADESTIATSTCGSTRPCSSTRRRSLGERAWAGTARSRRGGRYGGGFAGESDLLAPSLRDDSLTSSSRVRSRSATGSPAPSRRRWRRRTRSPPCRASADTAAASRWRRAGRRARARRRPGSPPSAAPAIISVELRHVDPRLELVARHARRDQIEPVRQRHEQIAAFGGELIQPPRIQVALRALGGDLVAELANGRNRDCTSGRSTW